jgi:glutamate carboxypeptidase
MPLSSEEKSVIDGIDRRRPELEPFLRALVDRNSFTANAAGVNQVGDEMAARLRRLGFRIAEVVSGRAGRTLVARRRGDGTRRLLLLGHLDTVHAPDSAFRGYVPAAGASDVATGPGAADMKGGLVVLDAALAALEDAGSLAGHDVVVILAADEEAGSATSADVIRGEAADAQLGLCFEAGRVAGNATTFVTARRGYGRFSLAVSGRAAHAGVDPGAGASAILELARKTVALEALNDPAAGTTVNVGVVRGGTSANVIAGSASAEVEYRWSDEDAAIDLEDAVMGIVTRHGPSTGGPGALSAQIRDHVKRPAMVRSEAIAEAAARLVVCGRDLGLELQEESRGGSSDAAFVADAGCTALCGLGAVGGAFHTDQEWVRPSSLAARAALAALFMHRFLRG